MTLFAVLVVLMLAVALAIVLWPLFAASQARGAQRDDLNVALYKDRSAELEQERDDGTLSDAEFEQALHELQRDLLVNVDPESETAQRDTTGGSWLPWVVALLVPVTALAFYLPLGSTDLIGAKPPTAQQARSGAPDLERAVAELRQHLKENPDNLDSWEMLGRTLNAMGRYEEAADTYGQAIEAIGEENSLLLGRAQALALAAGNRMSGEPIQLVRRVLVRDSSHPEALWLSGMYAFEQGDYPKAIERWQEVKAQLGAEGELGSTVDSAIAEARARLEGKPSASAGAPASTTELQIEVAVAPELADRIEPDDTVFVFAREPGSRMPVAAERRKAGELPLSITLNDDASMADRPLGDFPQLEIVARISKSGSVSANPGDIEGVVTTAPEKPVTLTIDRIIR
ncbi:cytochrome c-type biogenesis protein CcmH [Thiohalomonas denitrificans]|uniref:Cytochrome c-type biogenesis protein CcmH n=2 Tax=Thiohalomonas denitrificans TaxID=415747 RepID=A0A1G5Q9C2_9GAMM|nr:cytochrome c-type biogenesis protein CcmH [Thiohalomonas denitrificans]